MHSPKDKRQLIYLGSTSKDLEKLPKDVKEVFLAALKMALNGETHEDAKPFKYHGSGVFEIVCDYRGDAFREIYTVRYQEIIFVVHIFKKKSKKKSETPKEDIEIIDKRLKWAESIHKEQYGKKTKKNPKK
jgi:phage-related protein